MTMIHVLAMITTAPGLRDEVLEAFNANVPAVKAEDGCIEYGAAIDTEKVAGFQTALGEDSFVVIEKWESFDALKAHAASPHMAEYSAKTKDKLTGRVIHILNPA
jgi:quinol monooxygenase YgiN